MNVREWKVLQKVKELRISNFDIKMLVGALLLTAAVAYCGRADAGHEAGSGNLREVECAVMLADHAIIRDARINGEERETVKSWLEPNGPDYEALVMLIDEAYDATNVDAWFGSYVSRCLHGERDAAYHPVASSQALYDPTLAIGYKCMVRVHYAAAAIYNVRRNLGLPKIPASWSDAERDVVQLIIADAVTWPRGEIDYVEYVASSCQR